MKKNPLALAVPRLRTMASTTLICFACSTIALAAESAGQQIFYEAYELQQAGKLPEAAAKYEAGLKRDPKNAAAYYFLGEIYQQLGQSEKALRSYKQSLKLAPDGQYASQAEARLSGQAPRTGSSDPTKIVLPSGITLFDAATMIEARMAAEDPQKLMDEVARLIDKYGPVPKLMAIARRLLDNLVPALRVSDETTAKAKLPQIQQLRKTFPDNLELLRLEAVAYHYQGNFQKGKALYSQWLQKARPDNPDRPTIVAALANIAEGKAPGPKKLPQLPFSVSADAAAAIEADPAFQTFTHQKALRIKQTIRLTSRTDPTNFYEEENNAVLNPLGGGVFNLQRNDRTSYGSRSNHVSSSNNNYYAGGIKFISGGYCSDSIICNPNMDAKWTSRESDESYSIKFPLKTGDVFEFSKYAIKGKLVVERSVDASELISGLSGTAFEISEFISFKSEPNEKEHHDKYHYLVDYGIFTKFIIAKCFRPKNPKYHENSTINSFSSAHADCKTDEGIRNNSITVGQ